MKKKKEDTSAIGTTWKGQCNLDLIANNWDVENLKNAHIRFCDFKLKIHNNTDFWKRLTLSDVDL